METYFATPERSDDSELRRQIRKVVQNPVINGILCIVGGLIAVLNQNRQILAVNHCLLELMGVEDPKAILGLRPGEALGCRYAEETSSGCGTSAYCATCGAAIAIVMSQQSNASVQRQCSISVDRGDGPSDLFFKINASTIKVQQDQLVLIFMQDITEQQCMAALERAFFHDVKNTIMGLLNAGEILLLNANDETSALAGYIVGLSRRLSKEVELQRLLSKKGNANIEIQCELLSVEDILKELESDANHHPSKQNNQLQVQNNAPHVMINTDLSLLMRVLSNMLINAFEASEDTSLIRFNACSEGARIEFSVWNKQHISSLNSRRIFQRNFTTKEGTGRGLGTFSMNLIGEQLLGGHVDFQSSHSEGTRFFINLPIDAAPED